MRTFRILSSLLALAGLHAISARAAAEPAANPEAAALQVRVDAPYLSNLIHREEITDALYARVRDGVRSVERGAQLALLESDEAPPGVPLLTITLLHWRESRMGDIECRFAAEYRSADGVQPLGIFQGSTLSIARSNAFLGQDFEKAAEEAGRDLARALQKRKLI